MRVRDKDMRRELSDSTDVPSIPESATVRESRHKPNVNAELPKRNLSLKVDADIVAWFEAEARRGGLRSDEHINHVLRQYIINLIGDKPPKSDTTLQMKSRANG